MRTSKNIAFIYEDSLEINNEFSHITSKNIAGSDKGTKKYYFRSFRTWQSAAYLALGAKCVRA